MTLKIAIAAATFCLASSAGPTAAQTQTPVSRPATDSRAVPAPSAGVPPAAAVAQVATPADYVIGPDDVLQVLFWREKDNSAEVVVRPDGMISLPMLNDVQAGGLTPEQLRKKVVAESMKFFKDEPDVSVIVKTINSRRVFITGQVGKPGAYPLGAPTTVLQLIAMAGGLGEWASGKNIIVMRVENGKETPIKFNYKEVVAGKNLKQNILLKPGDTVIVP